VTAACHTWGEHLAAVGNLPEAARVYDMACQQRDVEACVREGQLYLHLGDFASAERPLQVAYAEGNKEAFAALADLHQWRGTPQEVATAERIRWDALALEEPASEFVFLYRYGSREGSAFGVQWGLQPMAFLGRRINVGADLWINEGGLAEANARVAYQHFVAPYFIPYMAVVLGGLPDGAPGHRFNAGTELGFKFSAGPVNLNTSVGSSVGSPAHVSVGVGMEWDLALAALIMAL
jgi:hypothetical protein